MFFNSLFITTHTDDLEESNVNVTSYFELKSPDIKLL
jgi:hypothetical protein